MELMLVGAVGCLIGCLVTMVFSLWWTRATRKKIDALKRLLAECVCPTPPAPLTDADLARGVEIARQLGHTIDDAVEWRLSNIEAQLKAQEGD